MFLKTFIFMVLLVSFYGATGITIRDNRYELNVALSERALTVDPADYDQFLLSVKVKN